MDIEKIACGALFISSKTGRVMFNLRADYKSQGLSWGFWGGMLENSESPKDCLLREISEEIGFVPDISKIYPFDVYQSKDKQFKYYSFICVVEDEFTPSLNRESDGYCWVNIGKWPKPLHRGAKNTISDTLSIEKLKIILSQHTK